MSFVSKTRNFVSKLMILQDKACQDAYNSGVLRDKAGAICPPLDEAAAAAPVSLSEAARQLLLERLAASASSARGLRADAAAALRIVEFPQYKANRGPIPPEISAVLSNYRTNPTNRHHSLIYRDNHVRDCLWF